jgi:hypothetical protein
MLLLLCLWKMGLLTCNKENCLTNLLLALNEARVVLLLGCLWYDHTKS